VDGKPWRIELLGAIRARYRDGAWRPLAYQKPVALFLYLAAYPQRPHPREALIELLWPGSDPEAGRSSLRVALYSLRRLLQSAGPAADALLLGERTTVRLDPAAFTTDLGEYRAAVAEAARARTPVDRCQALGQAAARYTGEFLPGFHDGWAFEERERLATTQRELLQRLVRIREEVGDREGAVAAAREMVCLDPLWEEAHYEVMRLYAALGQPSACLRQYQELERVLREELDEVPSAQVRALAEELRQGARSLVVARSAAAPAPPPALPLETMPLPAGPPPQDPDLPGRPAAEPHSRLPVWLTRFYGREEEIARLTELLALPATRLVTVTGSGGSGKTRLAIAAAGRMVEADPGPALFPEAVAFVSLADLADASRIPDAIAEALGLVRSPEVEALEQVITLLGARRWLLVLDNFEHLVEEGALLVRTLLARAPRLTCLVTSRQRLGLGGEQEFALLPLPTPRRGTTPAQLGEYASVQLFVDRARAVRADFALTPENAASVAELCDRLEGLPLALELAAARAGILTPRQMLAQLEQRFAFLVSRQRDVPQRHRTLRAAIESSYQLLTAELRRFFARLSVFRGGWTLAAAQAACLDGRAQGAECRVESSELPGSALDCLEQLRECSLIIAEEVPSPSAIGHPAQPGHPRSAIPEVRYRMLETLREFAFEQLSPEERAHVARRHAEYFLLLAEHGTREDPDPDREPWLERIERERLNLQVALGWSLADESGAGTALRLVAALRGFWENHPTEGREWVAAALAARGNQSAARRADALHVAGRLAVMQNDLPPARAALEECLALQRASGNRAGMATLLHTLGQCVSGLGAHEEARPFLEEAAAIRRELDDGPGTAWTLESLAWMLQSQGDLEQARRCLEESLAIARECGARLATALVLHGLGWIRALQGDRTAAESYLKESCAVAGELTARPDPAPVTYGMRRPAWRGTDEETARFLLEANLAFWRALGNPWEVIHTLGALGHLARGYGDYAGCAAFYRESLALRQERGDRFTIAQSLEDFACLAARQGEYQRAARLLGAADGLCARLGRSLPVAWPDEFRHTVASVREALGEEAFAAARSAGRVMSLQQAVDYALVET
jgi:predicted ATPase/DNA-binding SARP family transcriptional activator